MAIYFTARHANITPEIKRYCEKRLESLEKVLGEKVAADLILSVEKYRHKVELKIKARKTVLYAVEETHEMLSSLALAFDSVEKRAKKERDKLRERKRRTNRRKEAFLLSPAAREKEKRVIRSQDYSLKPMSLEEALDQFNLEKKEVFVFRKAGSERLTVLYRRKDGNYGLVEPE
jgi:putative sigma-54 modulation protein